jgi:hypothetical protein
MREVDVAFVGLEEVAFVEELDREALRLRRHQKLVIRKQRRLSGPEIGKDGPCLLYARIGRMANLITVSAPTGLARLIETAPANVIEPTMIETAEPSIFQSPVAQISATMRAVETE